MQTVRVAGLNNRVPPPVLWLEVEGAALALGLLAFYLSLLGRGLFTVLSAAVLVSMLLLVTFDLDRPTRGLIRVPSTPLTQLRASMILPPAASGTRQPVNAGTPFVNHTVWMMSRPERLAMLSRR